METEPVAFFESDFVVSLSIFNSPSFSISEWFWKITHYCQVFPLSSMSKK